jgi:RimJ/RimL family protein N-acetyltransferase
MRPTTPSGLDVPTLSAQPYSLRPFRFDDLDVVRDAALDPLIPLGTTVPATYTEQAAKEFIERQHGRARSGEGYSFAIAATATDTAVGQIGLWPRLYGRASLGYWVAPSARRRGAAGCALRAVVEWGLDELKLPRLELYIEPWNTASIRTAEAVNFHREGLLRSWQEIGGQRRDMFMYSLLASDR